MVSAHGRQGVALDVHRNHPIYTRCAARAGRAGSRAARVPQAELRARGPLCDQRGVVPGVPAQGARHRHVEQPAGAGRVRHVPPEQGA
eukprot:1012459-Rhodomonas_salina.1